VSARALVLSKAGFVLNLKFQVNGQLEQKGAGQSGPRLRVNLNQLEGHYRLEVKPTSIRRSADVLE
jgi:hypothetical protein